MGLMPDRYDPTTFESKWRERWRSADLFRTREDPERPKFYGLDFFPYPSGAGLSVGHCRNYIPTDVLCRMKFMQGYNVLHPMGFDAFGLPAENEAIAKKTHPAPMVKSYGENYRRQMDLIGISYDWSRSFYSSDPEYYRWTQWIFELLYRKGLAYRRPATVNWCPKDLTVLADEEVEGGLCWRCGSKVERKQIPQWFFKITAYADRLLEDLDSLDWPEGIKEMQRNWIGRSEGVEFEMKVVLPDSGAADDPNEFRVLNRERQPTFRVFTTRIDTVFGMTFCVLAPEHELVPFFLGSTEQASDPETAERAREVADYVERARSMSEAARTAGDREKTGVFSGFYALNPATGRRVPIWIADYVVASYGTGAIMAVPGHDERDFEFAQKYGIEIVEVIRPLDEGSPHEGKVFTGKAGVLTNSGEYNGQTVEEAQKNLTHWVTALGMGEAKVTYRLRDWLISRQRYWGCPIPVILDSEGGTHLVSEDCLPVMLPEVERYEPSPDGKSPLAGIPDFVNVTGPEGDLAQRETDTMGGFACSSWYFLRFCDPWNDDRAWDLEKVRQWMPVDCYVGGAEHAVMHLLYARFWTKVLFDEGLVPVKEPFQRLMNQGQVLALTPYRKPREGESLDVGQEGILVSFEEARSLPESEALWRWARMSKSKGNVVTPDEVVESHGADALRVGELFVAPFDADVNWSDDIVVAAERFLNRVFRLAARLSPTHDRTWRSGVPSASEASAEVREIRRATHRCIAKSTEDIERFAFNTYIAALMTFVNEINDALKSNPSESDKELAYAYSEALESLILLLAPAAPFSCDELWESLGYEGFTYQAGWPVADPELLRADLVTIAVQVNGKLRDTLEMPAGASQGELEQAALASERVQAHLAGRTVRRVIVVPGRLVNVVAP